MMRGVLYLCELQRPTTLADLDAGRVGAVQRWSSIVRAESRAVARRMVSPQGRVISIKNYGRVCAQQLRRDLKEIMK